MALLNRFKERLTAQNVFLDENTGGKGKYFKARFLQPGLVKYSFGVCVLEKDTIDKFINEFVGCPVIIGHKDVTNENAKDLSCGNICHVWYDEADGWYWGDGIIDNEEAVSLINEGYNVSCQYEITEYSNNTTNALHNGNPYDKVILNGKPEHLAIVDKPRYENAMIAMNALDKTEEDMKAENGWITTDKVDDEGNRIKIWIEGFSAQPKIYKEWSRKTRNEFLDAERQDGTINKPKFEYRSKVSDENKKIIESTFNKLYSEYKMRPVAGVGVMQLADGTLGVCNAMPPHKYTSIKDGKSEKGESKGVSTIALNSQMTRGKYTEEDWERGKETGFHPNTEGGMLENVITHEFAHAITANNNDNAFWAKVAKIRNEYMKNVEKSDIKNPDYVSKYARENKDEFVAECFTQAKLSKKPSKYAKQVLDLINEHYAGATAKNAIDSKDEQYEDVDEWIEAYGLGYPICEEAYEEYKKEQEKQKEKDKAQNSMTNVIKQAINEIKETDMFNKLFNRKDKQMEKDEMKSLFIECLQECLKAKNEEDKKEEEKEAENKCKNEVVDKRDIIRQIMAIAGKEEASEDVKTIAKLAEKLAYDKSEADDKADNCKGKNEDKEEEDKKEEAKNKAKNALEEMKALFSQTEVKKAASNYVSRSDAIELGNEIFG